MIRKEILNTIIYFQVFDYSPTFDEIYTFLKNKASKRRLNSVLDQMVENSLITSNNFKLKNIKSGVNIKYTLGEYSINNKIDQMSKFKSQNRVRLGQNYFKKEKISLDKIYKVKKYINILGRFPQIRLIGFSGSVSMMNAEENDDVDLFVITAKNRLWTGRFIALVIAQLMGIRRNRGVYSSSDYTSSGESRSSQSSFAKASKDKRARVINDARNKVCLNLFFDEKNLKVPKYKEIEYVAHEILQMKPIVQKEGVYLRFLDANRWVFDIFPNAKQNIKVQMSKVKSNSKSFRISNFGVRILSDWVESLLKSFQLYFIRKHQTAEIIINSQLWFHPDDFSKIIKTLL